MWILRRRPEYQNQYSWASFNYNQSLLTRVTSASLFLSVKQMLPRKTRPTHCTLTFKKFLNKYKKSRRQNALPQLLSWFEFKSPILNFVTFMSIWLVGLFDWVLHPFPCYWLYQDASVTLFWNMVFMFSLLL